MDQHTHIHIPRKHSLYAYTRIRCDTYSIPGWYCLQFLVVDGKHINSTLCDVQYMLDNLESACYNTIYRLIVN